MPEHLFSYGIYIIYMIYRISELLFSYGIYRVYRMPEDLFSYGIYTPTVQGSIWRFCSIRCCSASGCRSGTGSPLPTMGPIGR